MKQVDPELLDRVAANVLFSALVQTGNKAMQQSCKKEGYKKGHKLYFYEKVCP